MACHTSSREASGTCASTSPVAGLLTAIARSFVAPTHAPPTYIFTRSPMGLVVMRYSQRPAPYSSGECGARVSASLKVKPSTALANRLLSSLCCGGRFRIRTCDPCRVNPCNTFSKTDAVLATSGNHVGHTPTHSCTDQQVLARFGRRLAAFLLHEPERLLTVREVAEVLAVSTPIVYTLCERRELAHMRISNAIRVA